MEIVFAVVMIIVGVVGTVLGLRIFWEIARRRRTGERVLDVPGTAIMLYAFQYVASMTISSMFSGVESPLALDLLIGTALLLGFDCAAIFALLERRGSQRVSKFLRIKWLLPIVPIGSGMIAGLWGPFG
ncbi:hypothetical protein EV193_110206 [Herbihabitans rhizosphaerae]|uniref:Uncharacterized protein n=1 Tax=Herbihabitans rhizosphaerae TaxID=1872711 RepID=A0A4Q7KJK2_9PSEU|nr:hypothetical protein [Herbihabitans rhizosphaerae]RZS34056.1 hypothetical protein EV193_110206 [Herbihabitans rhizosphaerae]